MIPAGEPGALGRLVDNLNARARYENILQLENHDPESRLRGASVSACCAGKARDGSRPRETPPSSPKGRDWPWKSRTGATEPVYISVLDLGLSGRVSQVYPVRGAREPLAPGRTLQVGVRKGEELELYMPRAFPFTGDPATAEGTEHLKLFATTGEADFELLEQGDTAPCARRANPRTRWPSC